MPPSDGSRWRWYGRTYLDVGVQITRGDAGLEVAGHVATVVPGGPCLLCLSGYQPHQVQRELDPTLAVARRDAGYLPDDAAPAPSVLFLNQASPRWPRANWSITSPAGTTTTRTCCST